MKFLVASFLMAFSLSTLAAESCAVNRGDYLANIEFKTESAGGELVDGFSRNWVQTGDRECFTYAPERGEKLTIKISTFDVFNVDVCEVTVPSAEYGDEVIVRSAGITILPECNISKK